jgi:hypothetical protein
MFDGASAVAVGQVLTPALIGRYFNQAITLLMSINAGIGSGQSTVRLRETYAAEQIAPFLNIGCNQPNAVDNIPI